MSDLYRKEALDAQATKPYGKIILIQPPSLLLLTAVSIAFAVLVGLFLTYGSYTRHSTVSGQLLPDAGLIKVYAPRPGIVLEQHVKENQQVAIGDVLFVVSSERPVTGAAGIGDGARLPAATDRQLLVSKVAELRRQLDILDQQIVNQKARIALSRKTVDTYRNLLSKKYISSEQLQLKEADLLDQQARLQTLDRERIALTHEIGTQYVVITATQPGIATGVSASVGQAVDHQQPLLFIVPGDSELHATLYAPSRAVGFIEAGDPVLLRYEAYPYQKFGQHAGVVSWVSKTAIAPQEIKDLGRRTDSAEPLYEIRVKLDAQSILAYGKPQPLQAGMAVDADIQQERRRLYEWILDPLLTLTGRF